MNCPVCDVTLVISSREGIEVDHCPQCRGVWLDRGELDKIIDRAVPATAVIGASRDRSSPWDDRPQREERYRDDDDWDDRRRRRKRRGSFLEELFDFD